MNYYFQWKKFNIILLWNGNTEHVKTGSKLEDFARMTRCGQDYVEGLLQLLSFHAEVST